jgi:hypothetical protein
VTQRVALQGPPVAIANTHARFATPGCFRFGDRK